LGEKAFETQPCPTLTNLFMTKPILEDIVSNQDNPINCQEKIPKDEEVDVFPIQEKKKVTSYKQNHMLGVGGKSSSEGRC
jgi:hypothetical protein